MNILEQILEEIDQKIEKAKELMVSCPCDRLDVIANETAEAFIEAYKECQEIICSHMEDEPVSNTDKLDNGWIPVGETEGDRMMDEIQRTELIESHIEECKHRISVINGFMETSNDADGDNCCKNILRLKTAVTALEELEQYREIGTINECYGYKIHSQNIRMLNDCNNCGRKRNCTIKPRYGEYCRINCYLWEEDQNEPKS